MDNVQLSYVTGLMIGEFKMDTIFHTISWASRKSKRPVKSIGAAEILAASESIDEGKTLWKAFSCLPGIEVEVHLVLDTKDLYTSLSTQRNSID